MDAARSIGSPSGSPAISAHLVNHRQGSRTGREQRRDPRIDLHTCDTSLSTLYIRGAMEILSRSAKNT